MEQALMALLAPIAGGRRWFVRAPQGQPYPYVILNRASSVPSYTMEGPNGYTATRIQIDVYGDQWPSVFSDVQSLQALLSGYRGIVSGTRFQGIFIDSLRDLSTSDTGERVSPVTPLYRTTLDIIIHHSPA